MNPENGLNLRDATRKAFRTITGYMDDVVSFHIQVCLHMLTSNRGLTQCLHHHRTRRGLPNDHEPAEKTRVAGVPYLRTTDRDADIVEGYLHCGCSEQSALLELVWFKTGKITSPTTGLSDRGTRMDPRVRAFVVAEWHMRTFLRVEDLFVFKESERQKTRRLEGAKNVGDKATNKGKGKAKKVKQGEDDLEEDYVVVEGRTYLDVLETQILRMTERLGMLKIQVGAEEAEKKRKKEAKKAGPSRYVEDV